MNIPELFASGGIAMWPLLILSILALGTIIERIWFWSKILTREREVSGRVIEAARREWSAATDIAQRSCALPMGRVLFSALRLQEPDPEVFRLALETSANEELSIMRRGEKILEAVIALAPLLGLFGTVIGLIHSLGPISFSDLGEGDATTGAALGIAEALISTATGLVIAITSLAFYRIFQGFVFGQAKVFRQAGSELELLYRQAWAKRFKPTVPTPVAHLPEPSPQDTTISDFSSEANPT